MLQSSGHSRADTGPILRKIIPIEKVKTLIKYEKDLPVSSVFESLRYAGMHPPLYYVMLHYVLRYLGNEALTVRLLSVFFSTLSIVVMYFLGKKVRDEKTGLYAAVFLALSAYGVTYGPMVRPYPLALLLGLITTLQVYNLANNSTLKLDKPGTLVYIILVTAGLYTIYNFIFVFVFHFIFLIICNLKNKKNLGIIFIMSVLVFILYLPWLPSFFQQLRAATSDEYYFHGTSSLVELANYVTSYNFTRQLPGRYSVYKFIIVGVISLIMVLGFRSLFNKRLQRNLALTLGLYLLSYYTVDLLLNTKTLNSPKQLYFIVAISLLLAGLGVSGLVNRFKKNGIPFFVGLCCILLLNSMGVCRNKTVYDGFRYLLKFPKKVNASIASSKKSLVICNTLKHRYLLSFVHTIEPPADITVVGKRRFKADTWKPANITDYDVVVAAKLRKSQPGSKYDFSAIMEEFLTSTGFELVEKYDPDNKRQSSRIAIYRRKMESTKKLEQGGDN
jgi:uncharacterized membrane protein